jgi:hypothetical protein
MMPLTLPEPPPALSKRAVRAWSAPVVMPTYEPDPPDVNPAFLERRVYQGSSGCIYPLAQYNRIAATPVDRAWQAVHIENEYVRVMVLPEMGGRVHVLRDRTNGYDAVYRQDVVKPALVGLSGPWCSGGIEFNWPQHHRPGTYEPTNVAIEEDASDGSVTVWMSEHDPLLRLKGAHGVCLRPGCSAVELKVRLYNRTPLTQTFLWWANLAAEVHERYRSFFGDVHHVADHAKRAVSAFPLCEGSYYGVQYGERAKTGVPAHEAPAQFPPPAGAYPPNDLTWYANIPVPTSYMCIESDEDFLGGYDYKAGAGVMYVSDHHVSPGRKQWTWGNHEFGYAWDRLLTEPDENGVYRPYIELVSV